MPANKTSYTFRPANLEDVSVVTRLMHSSFEIWKKRGLKLSPMFQTNDTTAKHLLNHGFVALDNSKKIVGTFSLNACRIVVNNGKIIFSEGASAPIAFTPVPTQIALCDGRYLVFKKAAVSPSNSRKGLGRTMYDIAERKAKDYGFDGMALETVREADWLYQWYIDLGFNPIGKYIYHPGGTIETILMIKLFSNSNRE